MIMSDMLSQDVRYALRSLIKDRAFTIAAVVTLACGIGLNTAIFSLISGLILRPLPFVQADRLVQIHGTSELVPQHDLPGNVPILRSEAASFERMAGCFVSARYLLDGSAAAAE